MINFSFIKNIWINTGYRYLIYQSLYLGLPLILAPYILYFSDFNAYGRLAIFQALQGAISTITASYISSFITANYYKSQDKNSRASILTSCLSAVMINFLFLFLIIYCLYTFLPISNLIFSKVDTIFLIVSTLTMSLNLILIAFVQISGRFDLALHPLGVSLLIGLISSFIFIPIFFESGRYIAITISNSLLFLMLIKNLLNQKTRWFNIKEIMLIQKNTYKLLPHSTIGLVTSQFDKLIVASFLGIQQTGIYSLIIQINQVLILFHDYRFRLQQPKILKKLSKGKYKEYISLVKDYFNTSLTIIVGYLTVLSIGLFLFGVNLDNLNLYISCLILFISTTIYSIYYPALATCIYFERNLYISITSVSTVVIYLCVIYLHIHINLITMLTALAIYQVILSTLIYFKAIKLVKI